MDFIWQLFDTVFGSGTAFIIGASKESIEEKRMNRWMPLYSIVISGVAIGVMKLGTALVQKLILYIFGPLDGVQIWEIIKNVYELLSKFGANLAIAASFMSIYGLVRKIKKKLLRDTEENWHKYKKDFWGVYDYNEELDQHIITDQGNVLRKIFTFFIAANVIFICIWYGFICEDVPFFMEPVSKVIPMYTFMVAVEFYVYLTPAERNSDEAKQVKKSSRKLDMIWEYTIWNNEKVSGKNDCRLAEYERVRNFEYVRPEGITDEADMEDELTRYFIKYVRERENYGLLKGQMINAGLRLLKEESVYCACPLYRELDVCIFFLVYFALLKGEKGLIIVEDDNNLEEIRKWLKDGIEEIQGIYDLWNVEIIGDNSEEIQVGILSFQRLFSADIGTQKHRDFFENVGAVVILEPSDLLAGGQEVIRLLGERIKSKEGTCTWLLCDRNAENMIDLFSQLLQVDFEYVNATPMPAAETVRVCWNSDGERKTSWTPARRYLGNEADVILKTAMSGIERVYWYGEGIVPVKDMSLIMGQYYKQYCAAARRHYNQHWIDANIVFQNSGVSDSREKEKYLLLEDYMFNVAEMCRQYMNSAQEKCVLHIFSCDYLLRDFMLENKAVFDADPKFISQLTPEFVNSERNLGIGLIRKLLEGWQREDEIIEHMRLCEDAENSWADLKHINVAVLQRLILNVLDVDKSKIVVKTGTKLIDNKMERWFRLEDDRVENEFFRNFCQAAYVDESGEVKYISKLLMAGHLVQKYLPGQHIILSGKYYEVTGYKERENQTFLCVNRAFDKIDGRRYYRQNRKYTVKQCESEFGADRIPAMDQNGQWYIRKLFADIEVETKSYLILKEWRNLKTGTERLLPASKYHIAKRRYRRKRILLLGLNEQFQDAVKLIKTAGYLKECMCTFFPQYHHLLAVGVEQRYLNDVRISDRIRKYVLSELDVRLIGNEGKDFWIKDYHPMCIYIIEDSQEDLGLITALERSMGKLMNIVNEYEKWENSRRRTDATVSNII